VGALTVHAYGDATSDSLDRFRLGEEEE